jgi:hypothetical protein
VNVFRSRGLLSVGHSVFTDAAFALSMVTHGPHAAVSVTPKRTLDLMDAFLWKTSVDFFQTSQSVRGQRQERNRSVVT